LTFISYNINKTVVLNFGQSTPSRPVLPIPRPFFDSIESFFGNRQPERSNHATGSATKNRPPETPAHK
jgi:hypothetical protein